MESLPREVGKGAGTITSKGYGMMEAFQIMRSIIDSFQQEQTDFPKTGKKEQSQIDWESEIEEYWIASGWSKSISLGKFKVIARYFIGLALNAKRRNSHGEKS